MASRIETLENCLRQVADDEDIAARYLRAMAAALILAGQANVFDTNKAVQMAEMLEQSAAAAREVATDQGGGQ